ncbi:MAG: DoxX family protein [Planctomycetes bacterium]|nr:DoxX family protein [Planctomycetota bacterium]MBI3847833.1 DoxX family protein [Planctomycetota bacterium]
MSMEWVKQIAYFSLRVVTGLLFFQAGSVKFLGWFGGMPGQPPGSRAPLMTQIGIGGVLEFFGGIFIMLGLLTRPVAFILCGEMAVAYWQFHAPKGTWPVVNGGVEAVLFCFVFLYMAAHGGGEWSVDALIRRKRA